MDLLSIRGKPELFEERGLADELPDLMLQDVVLAFDCVHAV
jgi:hypothetical protein